AARVYANAAYARGNQGDIDQAVRAFRDEIQLLEQREKVLGPDAPDIELKPLVESLVKLMGYLEDRGLAEDPFYKYEALGTRAGERAEALLARSPGASVHEVWRQELAGRVDLYDGHYARANGDFVRAEANYQRAADRLLAARAAPGWFWRDLWLAQAHRGLA